MRYQGQDGKDLSELCHNIQKRQAHGITRIRCQSEGDGGGGYGSAPITAPRDALDGIDLDSNKYLCNTPKLCDDIRSKLSFEVALYHDAHERLKPYTPATRVCDGISFFNGISCIYVKQYINMK